jgi:hypothetical protein
VFAAGAFSIRSAHSVISDSQDGQIAMTLYRTGGSVKVVSVDITAAALFWSRAAAEQ